MNLYRFIVQTNERMIPVIVAANHDEKAFEQVEIELEKHFLKMPKIENITLHEKKKFQNRAGFVIDIQDL
ncbi:DUF3906 family protein [Bacillus alveayuensis]|jgi:hypothetical protein|uniref:DUF3906 family protein n=1 Tax=Aeribacillus alveayuensis TaxID=279215 RepID=A0ABT9VL23_9BACI|nr:DUF3906 family protein [Bacillus alveayuensis]MDQ0161676.1 hypothetical protein [Bacillus alveayuensis]